MLGCSPVHVAAKDSILTGIPDTWSVTRHEGILNLGIVVLLATNIRCAAAMVLTTTTALMLMLLLMLAAAACCVLLYL